MLRWNPYLIKVVLPRRARKGARRVGDPRLKQRINFLCKRLLACSILGLFQHNQKSVFFTFHKRTTLFNILFRTGNVMLDTVLTGLIIMFTTQIVNFLAQSCRMDFFWSYMYKFKSTDSKIIITGKKLQVINFYILCIMYVQKDLKSNQ